MEKLDPRLNAFRPDLADKRLIGQLEAARFTSAMPAQINVSVASLHKQPRPDATQLTQALYGEICQVFERANGWAWIQLLEDQYVGYVPESALSEFVVGLDTWFRVGEVSTWLFAEANLKAQPAQVLYLNSHVCVTETKDSYSCLTPKGAVYSAHLKGEGQYHQDFVAVAERFLNVPYYWGGKTHAGLDCSGLAQISLQASGIRAPRDSDLQEKNLGAIVKDHSKLKRGDLIFWPGHMGIMQSATQLIHANGHHMKVTSDLLQDVIARSDRPISSIKRLGA